VIVRGAGEVRPRCRPLYKETHSTSNLCGNVGPFDGAGVSRPRTHALILLH
jgi:hypothetical protein